MAALRLGWLAWRHRSGLSRLLVVSVAATVGLPLVLVGLAIAALAPPVQAAQALSRGVSPLTHWVTTQPFGCTGFYLEPPRGSCPHFHAGVDMASAAGDEVRAVMAGTVEISPIGGYGNHVFVHHGGDLVTLYAHLAAFAVVPGQVIDAGQVIGFEGSTGASTGPHLHFEVRKGLEPVDPVLVFPGVFCPGLPAQLAAGKCPAA
ncbi:MAG: M23 family metallopeptidase [Candidatus Dormiibacterota bacterium]